MLLVPTALAISDLEPSPFHRQRILGINRYQKDSVRLRGFTSPPELDYFHTQGNKWSCVFGLRTQRHTDRLQPLARSGRLHFRFPAAVPSLRLQELTVARHCTPSVPSSSRLWTSGPAQPVEVRCP